jgi:hypothetical protein
VRHCVRRNQTLYAEICSVSGWNANRRVHSSACRDRRRKGRPSPSRERSIPKHEALSPHKEVFCIRQKSILLSCWTRVWLVHRPLAASDSGLQALCEGSQPLNTGCRRERFSSGRPARNSRTRTGSSRTEAHNMPHSKKLEPDLAARRCRSNSGVRDLPERNTTCETARN